MSMTVHNSDPKLVKMDLLMKFYVYTVERKTVEMKLVNSSWEKCAQVNVGDFESEVHRPSASMFVWSFFGSEGFRCPL